MAVDLDVGNLGGGGGELLDQRGAVLADDDDAAQGRLDLANQLGKVLTLSVATDNPDGAARRQPRQGSAGGVRVSRLRVIDPRQVGCAGDDGTAVPSRAEGAQARLYGLGLDAVGTRQRGGGQSVRQDRG